MGRPVFPFAWCAVLGLEAPIRRFSRTRAPPVRFKPFGKASAPQLMPTSATGSYARAVTYANTRPLTDGTLNIDSTTTAEAHISARAEEVRQLGQRLIRDVGRRKIALHAS